MVNQQPKKDRVGYTQGLITITGFSHNRRYGISNSLVSFWHFKCECGNVGIIGSGQLRENQFSCGCRRGGRGFKKNEKQIIKPQYERKPWGNSSMQDYRASYIRRAIKKQIEFDLPSELFWKLTQANCTYCGTAPQQIIKGRSQELTGKKWYGTQDFIYNGIDRINSNKGYTKENSTTCCKSCNYAKNNMSVEEFKEHITKIAIHLNLI